MKKCEKCGWVTGNPADSFCEKCGGRLTEMPEKEAGDSQGKKGVIPIIAGCAAVAVLLIAGTVIGIRMMEKESRSRQRRQLRRKQRKSRRTARQPWKKRNRMYRRKRTARHRPRMWPGAPEKKSRIFRCLKLARRAPLRIRVRLQRRKNRHLPQQVMTFRK